MRQKVAFESQKQLELELGKEKAFFILSKLQISDILFMLFIFLLNYMILARDREIDIGRLLRTLPYGSRELMRVRLILSLCLSAIFSLFFWAFNLTYLELFYGFGSSGRYIQSMRMFSLAEFPLKTGEFLSYFIVIKIFFSLGISACFSLLISSIKRPLLLYFSNLLLLSLSYMAYSFIPMHSTYNALKYLNIFSLADVFDYYSHYQDINIFSIPIARRTLSLIFIFALLISASLLTYHGLLNEQDSKSVKSHRFNLFIKNPTHSLFSLECWRYFIRQYGIWIVLISILFASFATKSRRSQHYPKEREYYLDYYLDLQGELTENTLYRLDRMRIQLNDGQKDMPDNKNTDIKNAKSFLDTYAPALLAARRNAFQRMEAQILQSQAFQNRNCPVYVIDEASSAFWFDNHKQDGLPGLLSALCIFFSCILVGNEDRRRHILPLLKSTKRGHLGLFKIRVGIPFALAFILSLIFSMLQWVHAANQAYTLPWDAAVQSAPELLHFDPIISFRYLLIILVLYRVLSLLLQAVICQLLLQIFDNLWATLLLGSILFILPVFSSMLFPDFYLVRYFIFANAWTVSSLLKQLTFYRLLGMLILTICFIVIGLKLLQKRWLKGE